MLTADIAPFQEAGARFDRGGVECGQRDFLLLQTNCELLFRRRCPDSHDIDQHHAVRINGQRIGSHLLRAHLRQSSERWRAILENIGSRRPYKY